ncbi:MAG: hypothetical protein NC321_12735 [Clostridium sp.]|nr:hypothetical protein [Clostridium sp.]
MIKDMLKKCGKIGIWIVSFLGVGTMSGIILFLYHGFLQEPQIRCTVEADGKIFSVQNNFRSISINLHPQMLIQFDKENILSVYLKGYYEKEKLYFGKEKECKAIICQSEYVEKLQKYIKNEVISQVCLRNRELSMEEIDERLHIYVSTLGGVKYETEQGNEEKRYCIIEQDGIVIDYDEHDEEIYNRLYETELVMKDDFTGMKEDEKVNSLIQEISEEIIRITK